MLPRQIVRKVTMSNIDYSWLFKGCFTTTLSHVGWFLDRRIYCRLLQSAFTEICLNELVDRYFTIHSPGSDRPRRLDFGSRRGKEGTARFGRVTGIDASHDSVGNATKIYDDALLRNVTKSIDFPNKNFDIIYSGEAIRHINAGDKGTNYRECKRALKDGGILNLSVETFGKNWITKKLKKYGLHEDVRIYYSGNVDLKKHQKTINRLKFDFSLKIRETALTFVPSIDVVYYLRDLGRVFKLSKAVLCDVNTIYLCLSYTGSVFTSGLPIRPRPCLCV